MEDPGPESFWRRKWFVGVVAALIGVAVAGPLWGASMDRTTVEETPPLVATPTSTSPSNPAITVTETVNSTATETRMVETTATKTTQAISTATATAAATETETVKASVDPVATVTLVVTQTPVEQNTQGLTVQTATEACAVAAETALKNTYPESDVQVPRVEALVAALRSDVDAWFIRIGTTVAGNERLVDCSVAGSEAEPSVVSVKLR